MLRSELRPDAPILLPGARRERLVLIHVALEARLDIATLYTMVGLSLERSRRWRYFLVDVETTIASGSEAEKAQQRGS